MLYLVFIVECFSELVILIVVEYLSLFVYMHVTASLGCVWFNCELGKLLWAMSYEKTTVSNVVQKSYKLFG
jgi:hypothetical protein